MSSLPYKGHHLQQRQQRQQRQPLMFSPASRTPMSPQLAAPSPALLPFAASSVSAMREPVARAPAQPGLSQATLTPLPFNPPAPAPQQQHQHQQQQQQQSPWVSSLLSMMSASQSLQQQTQQHQMLQEEHRQQRRKHQGRIKSKRYRERKKALLTTLEHEAKQLHQQCHHTLALLVSRGLDVNSIIQTFPTQLGQREFRVPYVRQSYSDEHFQADCTREGLAFANEEEARHEKSKRTSRFYRAEKRREEKAWNEHVAGYRRCLSHLEDFYTAFGTMQPPPHHQQQQQHQQQRQQQRHHSSSSSMGQN
ncbi:hypothetical protein PTSG_08515 [Salpingoeca rosetta]|uniref:BZIP domain-containing protein n=1 Tax=Salpingoeca rosetta (strain ATCC 50818 / BSB-021) TaxID=946362 RepID=F2UJW7_SALR5|nr:uncharacterized protein PTSG_08515 [Salpingoeca rosetta]EGD77416.1 hypothetical protein PTSG_08515 [Salpingoeca rosetta]|eukprot:XP_004990760.1 hypothetical protein PTSG_08515 [Salpingoeca rosetta]